MTNLDAPYRRPIWQVIARRVRLAVVLLDGAIGADRTANRGSDWEVVPRVREYHQRVWATVRVKRGEARYYIARRALALRGVDVVLFGGWESPAYWQAALAATLTKVAQVGFYESHAASHSHAHGLVRAARARWFRRLDAVVVPGAASRDALLQMGVLSDRIFEGFNAVDVIGIAESARRNREPANGHRYLYIGQLIERKNVAALLRAFATTSTSSDSLSVAGSGQQEAALRALVGELGLEDRVEFLGYVPTDGLGQILGRSDTLVLPSRSEVWGLVVNEALAAGLHVVVSRVAGVASAVEHMRGVWLVDPDVEDLARGMRASRAAFFGPVEEPEILRHTPERFAGVFLRAFEFAVAQRRSRSRLLRRR